MSGGLAQAVVVAADKLVPVPDGVELDVACAAMLQGLTAHYLITSTYAVRDGDEVLVHAAAGGVGRLLVQLAKSRGAHVVATVGSDAKVTIAREVGADEVIRYDQLESTDDLAAAIREASHGGVHVAYDGVGRSTFDASVGARCARAACSRCSAPRAGRCRPVDPQLLNRAGSLFLTRPTLAHYVATRDELLWRAGELFDAIAAGEPRRRHRRDVPGRPHRATRTPTWRAGGPPASWS